jgi:catechol 2,3-dioxygenase-like lactoylglutathione lyase family enzyme
MGGVRGDRGSTSCEYGVMQHASAPDLTLDHFALAVSPETWPATDAFYRNVMRAQVIERGPGRFAFRWGQVQIMVLVGVEPMLPLNAPMRPGTTDMCFVWPGPIETALVHLSQWGVEVELGPLERAGARGQGQSVYFRDPDHNLLELITYPDGRDPR